MKNIYFGNESKPHVYQAVPGVYKIECWGGGSGSSKGGYVSGYIKFFSSINLYVYAGGKGQSGELGQVFNGGGLSQTSGGGASDVRLVGGEWDSFHSLKSRIIVAGAAGASDGIGVGQRWDPGGPGGGIEGFPSKLNSGQGGTQRKGGDGNPSGTFGKGGGNGKTSSITQDGNGAGGGGYFGGGAGKQHNVYGGGGGSSFISGHEGCYAIDPASSNPDDMIMKNDSIHYTGLSFYKTEMIDGNSTMPSPFGDEKIGVVIITLIHKFVFQTNCNQLFPKLSILLFVFIFNYNSG